MPTRATDQGRALRPLALAVTAVAIGAVVIWASGQEAPRLPSSAGEWSWALGAVALYGLAMAIRGERWLRIIRRRGADPSRADSQALTVIGYAGNNVLLLRAGDAIRSWLIARRAEITFREAAGTLVAERVLDAVFLLALYAALAYGILSGIDTPGGDRLAVGAGIAAGAALAAVVLLRVARKHPRGQRIAGFLEPVWKATADLRGVHAARMTAFTVAVWAAEGATYYAGARAVGLEFSILEAYYVVAIASVFVLVPSGPGYAGTLDAAILFGAEAAGATGSEAVSYLLLMRFVLLVPVTLLGLVLMVTRYGGWDAVRQARAGAKEAAA